MTTAPFYLWNVVMLAASVGALVFAVKEGRRRTIHRWRLLAPGVLSAVSVVVLLAFPEPWDLRDVSRWLVLLLAILAGGVRGRLMALSSDHALGLVQVPKSPEVLWVALAQLLFAVVQFSIETITAAESRIEPAVEFLMMVTAGYLLGRGAVAWIRAGSTAHVDLHD